MGAERALPRTIEFHHGLLTPGGGDAGAAAPLLVVAALGAAVLAGGLAMGAYRVAAGAAAVMACAALPLGWRSRVLVDREARTVSVVRYLFGLPLRTVQHDLSSVRSAQVVHHSTHEGYDQYAVDLEVPGGPLRLETVADARTAKSEGERVARFCGVEVQLPDVLR